MANAYPPEVLAANLFELTMLGYLRGDRCDDPHGPPVV